MFQLKDYSTGAGLSEEEEEDKMGKLHTFEGDILLTAKERAQFSAAAMNDGPEKRKLDPRKLGRSGLVKTSARWPGRVLRYQWWREKLSNGEGRETFSDGEKEIVRKVLKEFEGEISCAFPPV